VDGKSSQVCRCSKVAGLRQRLPGQLVHYLGNAGHRNAAGLKRKP